MAPPIAIKSQTVFGPLEEGPVTSPQVQHMIATEDEKEAKVPLDLQLSIKVSSYIYRNPKTIARYSSKAAAEVASFLASGYFTGKIAYHLTEKISRPAFEYALSRYHDLPALFKAEVAKNLSTLKGTRPDVYHEFCAANDENHRYNLFRRYVPGFGEEFPNEDPKLRAQLHTCFRGYFQGLKQKDIQDLTKAGNLLRQSDTGSTPSFSKNLWNQIRAAFKLSILSQEGADAIRGGYPLINREIEIRKTEIKQAGSNHQKTQDKVEEASRFVNGRSTSTFSPKKIHAIATESLQHYYEIAHLSFSGLRNFGIDPGKAEKKVYAVGAAAEVVLSVGSIFFGNPMGPFQAFHAASRVYTLLFRKENKQQPSPFETLFQGMAQLFQGQQTFFHTILRQQDELIKGQQFIQTSINQLRVEVLVSHQQIMGELAYLTFQQEILTTVTNANAFQKIDQLKLCREMMHADRQFSRELNRFESYSTLEFFYKWNKKKLGKGLEGLEDHMSKYGNPIYYALGFNVGNKKGARVEQYFISFWNTVKARFFNSFGNQKFLSLTIPCAEISELSAKTSSLRTSLPIPDHLKGMEDHEKLFERLIDPTRLATSIELALDFHYFLDIVHEPGGELLSIDDLRTQLSTQKSPSTVKGYQLLRNALMKVDTAIAQYNLLSGDLLIPQLGGLLMSSENDEDIKVLASNRCLMNNMLVFHIKALLENKNIPPLRYHTAFYSYSEPHRLQALLGTTKKMERKEPSGQWEIEIGETWIPLPSPVAVIHGELQLLPEVYDLLNLRRKILDEIQGYEMLDSLETIEDRQAYLSILLKEKPKKEKQHDRSIDSRVYAKL